MANSKKNQTLPPSTYQHSNKKKVLGLDLSLTGTGWCLNDKEELQTGLIETKKMLGLERIHFILTEVMKLIDIETLVVIEDFSFASKGSSLFQIAGLGYIIRHELWSQGIDFILVPPTVLKKFVTGAGNSDKSVMLKEIYKRWGADINDDNIGDGYGLSRIGRAVLEWDTELVGFQKEALKQLNKKE
jgi:Holliday junction resolvasome RuvABC endonuclease subunit